MTVVGSAFAGIGRGAWLIARAGRGGVDDLIEQDELALDRLAGAFERLGWRPLGILATLAALIGLAMGIAASRVLETFYAERLVEPVLVRALARDVVPLLIGIFAAGRVAVETAARLGAMRLNSELDALQAIGADPVRYVVTPALAAVLIATPLQVAVAFVCAWLGMGAVLSLDVISDLRVLADTTLDAATFLALLIGCGKALLYQLVALAVGAGSGTVETRGITAVGRQSMHAFTTGLLFVIALAAVSVLLQ